MHAHDYKTDSADLGCWRAASAIVPLSTAHGLSGESRNERILLRRSKAAARAVSRA